MTFKATYIGANGWIIEFDNSRLVIDPWLVGDLIFPPGKWFFKGTLKSEIPTPTNVDLILLTQGLPDHCHIPSLKKFPKNINIICSKSAFKSIDILNFENIQIMEPGEKFIFNNINIEATSGAAVPQIENGYILESKEGSFYIEPHGFLDNAIKPRKLDAVITPTKNLELPMVGSFIKGAEVIPKLINKFNPDYILSSTTGGDAEFSGMLNTFISLEEYKDNLSCKIIDLDQLESLVI
tara:strand:- start:1369 stop:2082 length:714 start_codon:yes stop_codon:yes gene_type:complete